MSGVRGKSGRKRSLERQIIESGYPVRQCVELLGTVIEDNWTEIASEYIRRAISKSDVLLLDIINRKAGKVKDSLDIGVHQELTADQIARIAEQVRGMTPDQLPLNTANSENHIIVDGDVIGGNINNNTANDEVPF